MTAEAAKINTPNPISVTQSCVAKAGGTEFSKTEVFGSWDDMMREWRVDEGSYDD